jgi:hypothetical protein
MSERMERLKSLASLTGLDAQDREDVLWAHDEIERLRGVRSDLMQAVAEIERLRAALLKVQELCGTVEVADHMALAEVSACCWNIAKEALGDE